MTLPPAPQLAPAIAVALGLGGFVCLWAVITGLLATVSGWTALAATFPGGERPAGDILRGQILGLGPIREKNVTNVVLSAQGLYLYPMVLFRFRRAPVLVPWSRIRYEDTKELFGMRWHTVELGSITSAQIRDRLLTALRDHGVPVPATALAAS